MVQRTKEMSQICFCFFCSLSKSLIFCSRLCRNSLVCGSCCSSVVLKCTPPSVVPEAQQLSPSCDRLHCCHIIFSVQIAKDNNTNSDPLRVAVWLVGNRSCCLQAALHGRQYLSPVDVYCQKHHVCLHGRIVFDSSLLDTNPDGKICFILFFFLYFPIPQQAFFEIQDLLGIPRNMPEFCIVQKFKTFS